MIQNFLVLLFGGALLRQQRKKTWGLVYNSVTKKPVSGAIVILFSKSGNLYTTFTNNEGRFGFLPEKGDTYQIRVEKSGYTFPSEVVLSNTDGYIKHVYQQSQTFIITEENPNIQVSLPLDPRLTAYLKTIARIKNVIGQFWDNLAVYLLLGFLVLSGFSMIINPNFLNSTLFAMYLLITAVNLKQRLERARTWGVVESSYGQRITNATIKLYRTTKHGDKDELYTTTSTNGRGRYQFVPEYGYYILEVKHPDIQKYQSLVSVSPNKPFINERIVLEPVKKQ